MVNTPAQIASGILESTQKLAILARGPLNRRAEVELDTIRLRNERYRHAHCGQPGYRPFEDPPIEPTYGRCLPDLKPKKADRRSHDPAYG